MSRPSSRKVRIVLQGREPDDPLALLSAVKAAFNPREIEITGNFDSEIHDRVGEAVPNELLETQAAAEAKSVLDQLAQAVADHSRLVPDQQGLVPSDPGSIVKQRRSISGWLKQKFVAGWAVTVYSATRGATAAMLDRAE